MHINIQLFVVLVLSLVSIVILRPYVADRFIVKVEISDVLLMQNGKLFIMTEGFWSPVNLWYRPISVLNYSIFTMITGMPITMVFPIYAMLLCLIYYMLFTLYRRFYDSRKLSQGEYVVLFSMVLYLLVIAGASYFSINGYHALSILFLLLFVYSLLRLFTDEISSTRKLLLLIIFGIVTLLTHQYSTGIIISMVFLSIPFVLFYYKVFSKTLTLRKYDIIPILITVAFLDLLIEIFVLPDLELLAENFTIDEIINGMVIGVMRTVLKVIGLQLQVEPMQHLKYIEYLKSIFPLIAISEYVEGGTKYLLILAGLIYGITVLKQAIRGKDRKRYWISSIMIMSSFSLLFPSLIYSLFYGALTIIAFWVFVLLYVQLLGIIYLELEHPSSKLFIRSMKSLVKYFIIGMLTLSAILSVIIQLQLIPIREPFGKDSVSEYIGFIIARYANKKYVVLSDFYFSANIARGSFIKTFNASLNASYVVVSPFGVLAYELNCTDIRLLESENRMIVFSSNNVKYGLFGDVAQYYVPPEHICIQWLFAYSKLILSAGNRLGGYYVFSS